MADPELNRIAGRTRNEIASERRVRRARQGEPRSDSRQLKAHARGRSRPLQRADPAARPGPEARRNDHRDRRVRHGQPRQVVGAQRPDGSRRLCRSARRMGRPSQRAAQRWQHDAAGRPGLEGARSIVVDTPGNRRGRRRGPRSPRPRRRPACRPASSSSSPATCSASRSKP